MKPEDIDQLRQQSLESTLSAVRSRRVRRRASVAVLIAAVASFAALMLLPRPISPPPTEIASVSRVAPPPSTPAPAPHILRTGVTRVVRISTPEKATTARFGTDPQGRVERLDSEGLSRAFPGKSVAVIRNDGELPEIVIF
jgi:hypothetical protein